MVSRPLLLILAIIHFGILFHIFLLLKQREPLTHDPQDDPLFIRFPLSSTRTVRRGNSSSGDDDLVVPTPFHCYNADVLVFQGRGNWTYLNKLLEAETYAPVRAKGTNDAFLTVWVVDYLSTAMGGYKELIVSVVVSPRHQRGRALEIDCGGNVYCSTALLAFDPRVSLFPVKLWLSETVSIDYGREVLGLNKVRCDPCTIERHGQRKSWRFVDKETGQLLLEGSLHEDDSVFSLLNEIPSIARAFGLRNLGRLLTNSYSQLKMIGWKGLAPAYPEQNPVSLSYSRVDPLDTKIQRVDGSDFKIGEHPDLRSLDFVPQVATRTRSQRFVILNPHN